MLGREGFQPAGFGFEVKVVRFVALVRGLHITERFSGAEVHKHGRAIGQQRSNKDTLESWGSCEESSEARWDVLWVCQHSKSI